MFEFQSFKPTMLRDMMATGMTEFSSKNIRKRRSQIESEIGRNMARNRAAADRAGLATHKSNLQSQRESSLLDKLKRMNLLRTQQ